MKSRKIIMGVAALALLGGGGAGAFFYFKKPAEAALPPGDEAKTGHEAKAEEHAAAKEGAKEGEGGEHGAAPAGPQFVKMDPLMIPIVDEEGNTQVVSLVVAFEVEGDENLSKVNALQPRARDAFLMDLYGMLNQKAAMENGVVKLGYVKKRLSDISSRVFGEEAVKDVLIQTVQQNPI